MFHFLSINLIDNQHFRLKASKYYKIFQLTTIEPRSIDEAESIKCNHIFIDFLLLSVKQKKISFIKLKRIKFSLTWNTKETHTVN